MLILSFSAAFVGLVHSLAPNHWLPVVLMAKSRKWKLQTALVGALATALGHILLSCAVGLVLVWIELKVTPELEELIERHAGLFLGFFGLVYAAFAYFRHSGCHGHTHHGPDPKDSKAPFFFLFSLGLSPCVAVIPVLAAAATQGTASIVLSLFTFTLGVLTALLGSTVVVTLGLVKLDHPIFEHYGDVITGLGVFIMGVILYFYAH